jgi:hypothetical protein
MNVTRNFEPNLGIVLKQSNGKEINLEQRDLEQFFKPVTYFKLFRVAI